MNKEEMQEKVDAVDKLSRCLLVSLKEQDLNVGVSACLSIAVAAMASAGVTRDDAVKHITVAVDLLYKDREDEAANSTKH